MSDKQVLVTGAAGFMGSHLTERLLNLGFNVIGLDNLSSGKIENLSQVVNSPQFRFIRGDLLEAESIEAALGECGLVFHLAADPEVRVGATSPETHLKQNLLATYNLLEAIRLRGAPTRLVFTSTSTVYGEPTRIPTPEDYGPPLPISTYGATKLACEALAASYSELLPLRTVIFRFANVVGARAGHGVIYDFIMKLRGNPRELEVLGDGTQSKSYVHIEDCLDAFTMFLDANAWRGNADVYNIGTEEQTNVLRIAEIVSKAMELRDVTLKTTGVPGARAWPGDVKIMQLDVRKIKSLGWRPKHTSDEAVQLATNQLLQSTGQR